VIDYLEKAMEQDREESDESETLPEEIARSRPYVSRRKDREEKAGDGPLPEEESEALPEAVDLGQVRRAVAGVVERALAAEAAEIQASVLDRREEETPAVEGTERALPVPAEGTETRRAEAAAPARLWQRLARSAQWVGAAQGRARHITVEVPESGGSGGWDLYALDRSVERDARRYDGGFGLY